MNFLVYSNPNFSTFCQVSQSTSQTQIVSRDEFADSRQKIRTETKLYYTYGYASESGCQRVYTGTAVIYGDTGPHCTGATPYELWLYDIKSYACYTQVEVAPPPCDTCSKGALHGNTILAPTREKIEFAQDIFDSGPMPLEFRRIYRSHRARDKAIWFSDYFRPSPDNEMGDGWLHNHNISLAVAVRPDGVDGVLEQVRVQMGDGTFHYFYRSSANLAYTARNSTQKLAKVSGASYTWVMTDGESDTNYFFDKEGKILEQVKRNGWRLSYKYTDRKISSISNQFGRSLQLSYSSGKLMSVSTSDQRSISFVYSNGFLTNVRKADGTNVKYRYASPGAGVPALLAGKIDETGATFATYTYSAEGWASETRQAGGVNRYSVPSKTEVIDPLGTSRNYNYKIYNNELVFQSSSKPSALIEETPVYTGSLNLSGLVDFNYDHNYQKTSYKWDATRRLLLTKIEGVGSPQARSTKTTWHSQWHLPTKVTTVGQETSYAYDGLGNVLSKTITDTSVTPAQSRIWSWTYHPSGLVATESDPNGSTRRYLYDSFGNLISAINALGQVDTFTYDGAGRVLAHAVSTGLITSYTYDALGRVLTTNTGGLVTTFTYRPTGQVATVSTPAGFRVIYGHDAAHRLVGWTDNRGAKASYQLDGMGNRVKEIIADSQGRAQWSVARSINSLNRVETVTVGSATGEANKSNVPVSYRYDANGDLVAINQVIENEDRSTRYGLDALRRVSTITDPQNATASLSYNAQDDITQAKDFKNATTNYTRDALGNAKTEASLDIGKVTTTYDSLGLPQTIVDALGRATSITRDLLGRPTQLAYADGTKTTLLYDLPGANYNGTSSPNASVGYLSEVQDAGVKTIFVRDLWGRVIRRTQILDNGDTRALGYSYQPAGSAGAGQINVISYPSGKNLKHTYDATGQLTKLDWDGQPLLTNIIWNPLGQPTGWTWPGFAKNPGNAASLAEKRTYTDAGQLASSGLLQLTWDGAGRLSRLSRITQQHLLPTRSSALAQQVPLSSAYTYDANGRLTASAHNASAAAPLVLPAGWSLSDITGPNSLGYAYDANGNRTQASYNITTLAGTATLKRTTATPVGSNRLTSRKDVYTPAGGAATSATTTTTPYPYDASGALTKADNAFLFYGPQGRIAKASATNNANAPAAVSYQYNSAGQRLFKTDTRLSTTTPVTEQTLYAEDDIGSTVMGQYANRRSANSAAPAGEMDSTEVIYLPTASGPMPVATQINGRLYAINADHLNTPRRLTNTQGQVAWQWLISGFGEVQPTTGATGYALNGIASSKVYSEAVTFKLRYPGQVWDEETGLAYNLHRYYDAQVGRYVQADPIGLDGGWNRFGYVGGDSLSYSDPLGLCPCGNVVDLLQLARSDKRDWSQEADRSDVNKAFGEGTYKCNLFADEQYETAGYNLPNVGGMPWSKGKYPPGAGQLSDSSFNLFGWPRVDGPAQPGDLVAHSGHVGIATTPKTTISAAPNGKVENNWGGRRGQEGVVIRRCSCGG